jgi:hypothetical protein
VIKAVVELTLVYPYVQSLMNLFDFISLWDCTLVSAGTLSNKATIAIPSERFKILFGENPRKGIYKIPTGAGYFLEEECIVKEVITK